MAIILELAAYAEVSAESVLRVVHGEPVSQEVEERVRAAIEALGPPSYPRGPEVLPALTSAAGSSDDVGATAYVAPRGEVQPVARHLAELRVVFDRMLERLEDVSERVEAERRDRLEDVSLLSELLTSGWRSVDRRLARLEQVVARIEAGRHGRREARLYRLDDPSGLAPPEGGTNAALGES